MRPEMPMDALSMFLAGAALFGIGVAMAAVPAVRARRKG
jgi:hypothetical protein